MAQQPAPGGAQDEGPQDPGGQQDSEQGAGEGGMPPEAVDAALTVLMMMVKAGGPNAKLYEEAGKALQSDLQGQGGDQASGPAQPEQAGNNPNAVPMR
jgi:hypothetical protein